jgi:lipopolysaccharide/colanic/teichoic acid biosynthesis glycosyltransferase
MSFSISIDRLRRTKNLDASFTRSDSVLDRLRARPARAVRRRNAGAAIPEPSKALLAAKRGIDILGAGFGLLVFAPLFVGIAIVIKATSPGPVFFRQKRYGYHNRRFWIFKFRTMYTDRGDARGTQQAVAGDPRITPIGRILRKSSLDELPQLINVLKGDMSLVGPRPLVLAEHASLNEAWQARRADLRPGLTGPWQISGRSHIPFQDMIKFDYQYVAGWSLARDIEILLATLPAVISGRGAY